MTAPVGTFDFRVVFEAVPFPGTTIFEFFPPIEHEHHCVRTSHERGVRGLRIPVHAGVTVYRLAGVWYAQRSPNGETLMLADRIYRGGHIHPLTLTQVSELQAAGYGAYIIERDE